MKIISLKHTLPHHIFRYCKQYWLTVVVHVHVKLLIDVEHVLHLDSLIDESLLLMAKIHVGSVGTFKLEFIDFNKDYNHYMLFKTRKYMYVYRVNRKSILHLYIQVYICMFPCNQVSLSRLQAYIKIHALNQIYTCEPRNKLM